MVLEKNRKEFNSSDFINKSNFIFIISMYVSFTHDKNCHTKTRKY